ncbi:MAG TPA: TlpA disulfide reductase family protein [Cyclobacteriaceae bacterium]|nr:TlpA disulfide reductase family protein [Cyclobacteriaceae bacterium]
MKKNIIISVAIASLFLGSGYLLGLDKTPSTEPLVDKKVLAEDGPAEIHDAEGNAVNFAEFKGKLVFINNWATWCPPCVAEMPTIEKLKEEMPEDEVAFVMVSYDRNPRKAINWMKNKKMELPVYFPGENFPRQFTTDAIPATFVLDREGKILHTYLGMADYSKESFVHQMKLWLKQ